VNAMERIEFIKPKKRSGRTFLLCLNAIKEEPILENKVDNYLTHIHLMEKKIAFIEGRKNTKVIDFVSKRNILLS
jgi:hypothetical protein